MNALSRIVPAPLYWSVRRELWENRALYIVPLALAVMKFLSFAFSTIHLPKRRRAVLLLDAAQQRAQIEKPYDTVAVMILVTMFIVAVFYCADAIYGERRDRSILFWKSLPVSDRTAVLSKAAIPMIVLPLLGFAIIVATQLLMFLSSALVLLLNGLPATTHAQLPLLQSSVTLLYGLIVITLWHAPIYAWLLLVSAWAKRAVFIWALLPLLAVMALEAMFNSANFGSILLYRLGGMVERAFQFKPNSGVAIESLAQLTPGRYLSTPSLWVGLTLTAAFLAAAVRLRRNRESI